MKEKKSKKLKSKKDPNKRSGVSAKEKSKKKKIKLAKESESKIERGMSVTGTRSGKVKRKKKAVSEDTSLLKKKKRAADLDEEEDDDIEDEDDVVTNATSAVDVDEDEEDYEDGDEEDGEDDLSLAEQIEQCDPGPALNEVPCGFNCGSCSKFVKIDDARRQDSEWLTAQMEKKVAKRCPFLFPEDLDIAAGKSVNDYVMRADSPACDKFSLSELRASTHLRDVLTIVRQHITSDELTVLQFSIEHTRKLKKESVNNGYSLGQHIDVPMIVGGVPRNVKCEVIDFQRKKGAEVVVRPLAIETGIPKRAAIPALRYTAEEE